MAVICKFKDYEYVEPKEAPTPYWPKLLYPLVFRQTRDKRKVFGRWWELYAIDLAWSTPGRSKYVERYHLEFLATFRGWAKTRTLHVWSLYIWPFHSLLGFRRQRQEKIKPIEGTWTDG